MSSLFKQLLLWLALAATALAANTQISTDKPIVNFRLPVRNDQGYFAWMARGAEARYTGDGQISIKDLTLSVFTGKADEKVDTLIMSPAAVVNRTSAVVSGPSTIRVINDQLEATGTGWSYAQKDKKVSIAKHVRVTFRAEFKDFLK